LFDRLTGKSLFPIEERPVSQSNVEGERTSPTQPFPSVPPPLAPQKVSFNDLFGATEDDLKACQAMFQRYRNDGIFTPPSLEGSIHVPGNIGGMDWGGAAWDPVNRLILAPVNRDVAVIRLIPQDEFWAERRKHPGVEITAQQGAPFAMSREFFHAPSGIPCVRPPWGELVAVSPDKGTIEWRVPLGEAAFAGKSVAGLPNLGGPATTNTGVVFIGASLDPHLRAFDTATGKLLWQGELPTAARATPLVFIAPSGRQMVAIAAGGFDNPLSKLDTKLVVFALNEKECSTFACTFFSTSQRAGCWTSSTGAWTTSPGTNLRIGRSGPSNRPPATISRWRCCHGSFSSRGASPSRCTSNRSPRIWARWFATLWRTLR
jgi:quinoprotein glucose dehydrogenase